MEDAAIDVTVAMVALNSERHLREAYGSLAYGMAGVASWRLIVADSDSADGTVKLTRRLQPGATVVAMGRNAGYLLRYCPGATAMHVGGESQISAPLHCLLTMNRLRLYRRPGDPAAGYEKCPHCLFRSPAQTLTPGSRASERHLTS